MLLKAPGAKLSAAASQLLPLLPQKFNEYREPMAYGAGLYWLIDPSIPRWLNDINPAVIDFYRWFRDDPDSIGYILGLQQQLRTGRDIFDHFLWCKFDFWSTGNPKAFWFLNQYAWYRIVLRSQHRMASFDPRNISHSGIRRFSPDMLQRARALLKGTKLTCGDFGRVVEAKGNDPFIYNDPPYRRSQQRHKLYDFCLSDADWLRLARLASESGHKLMLTVGAERWMRELFPSPPFSCTDRDYYGWWYSMGRAHGRWHRDLVIRNY